MGVETDSWGEAAPFFQKCPARGWNHARGGTRAIEPHGFTTDHYIGWSRLFKERQLWETI